MKFGNPDEGSYMSSSNPHLDPTTPLHTPTLTPHHQHLEFMVVNINSAWLNLALIYGNVITAIVSCFMSPFSFLTNADEQSTRTLYWTKHWPVKKGNPIMINSVELLTLTVSQWDTHTWSNHTFVCGISDHTFYNVVSLLDAVKYQQWNTVFSYSSTAIPDRDVKFMPPLHGVPFTIRICI